MSSCRCALRRPADVLAIYPVAKCQQLHFIITWVKFHIVPPHTHTLKLTHLPRQPLLDLPLDLGKCHRKFGDASYYRDRMHSQQTDILLYIC